jgi:hypothetical protein
MSRWTKLLLAGGGLMLAAALLVLVTVAFEIKEQGRLLEFTSQDVIRVEVFGSDVYLPERLEAWADSLNSLLLAGLAAISAFAAILFGRPGTLADRHLRHFFTLAALGAAALGLDEALEISEALTLNVEQFISESAADVAAQLDALLYLAVAVAFLVYFRDVLLSSRRCLAWVLAGGTLAFISFVLDVFDTGAEEALEVVATVALLVGFLTLALENVSQRWREARAPI